MNKRTEFEGILIVNSLMIHNQLRGWSIMVNRRFKRCLASCNYTDQRLEFRPNVLTDATKDHLEQIALHEIAHALTPNTGHNPEFREKAREIGCRDSFIYSETKDGELDYLRILPPRIKLVMWVGEKKVVI